MMDAVLYHLLISTVFAVFVAVIVWIRKADAARFRYCLWLAATLKFAIPTTIFSSFGSWMYHMVPAGANISNIYPASAQVISQLNHAWPPVSGNTNSFALPFVTVWLLGAVAFLTVWMWRFRSQVPRSSEASADLVAMVSGLSRRMGLRRRIAVRSATDGCDLALYGAFQSVLLVPSNFSGSLNRDELEAVLTHELTHVRRWDNFAAIAVHVITCVFWFHPVLWWIERRLIAERELACDEAVIDQGWSANIYATGILKLCQFHFAELRAGACGFSGSSLHERMERIMSYTPTANDRRTSLILWTLGAILALAPAIAGFMTAHPVQAQAQQKTRENHTRPSASCVFADKRFPEGAIIREAGQSYEQLCTVALGTPTWVRTSSEIRQRGQSITEVPVKKIAFCTPKASTSKTFCTCEEGGLYPANSLVDSLNGALSCTAGRWNPVALKNKK